MDSPLKNLIRTPWILSPPTVQLTINPNQIWISYMCEPIWWLEVPHRPHPVWSAVWFIIQQLLAAGCRMDRSDTIWSAVWGVGGLLCQHCKLVRTKCVRTNVVRALADVLTTKLGIILSTFFFFHAHTFSQLLCGHGVRALWVTIIHYLFNHFQCFSKVQNLQTWLFNPFFSLSWK